MKKNDTPKNQEDRKGFWGIGYLEKQDYPRRILEITHREMDGAELDDIIEKSLRTNEPRFFDINFMVTAEEKAVYSFYTIDLKAYRSNNDIIAGYYRMGAGERWRGVYLEQREDILKTAISNQRQRSALEDYTYIYDYQHIGAVCDEEFEYKRTEEQWANYIGGVFLLRQRKNMVYTFPTGSYFPAEERSSDGRKMYFWMENNDKYGAKQKGFGLHLVDEEDLLEYWSEAQYKYTLDRLVFSGWEALEGFVDEVASTAMPENWGRMNAVNPESAYGHPVLRSYIEYTLIRLRYLEKEKKGFILKEGDQVYFNSGLLNKFFRQILVGAKLEKERHDVPGLGEKEFEYYNNPYIIVTGHDTKFPTTKGLMEFPKIANYFERKEDVLYDASLEIMLNDEHIFEDGLKAGRIPMFRDEYHQAKNNPDELKTLHIRVQARIQIAIQRARLLAERNHKLAVPQFWKDDQEVQFLLPLYMEEAEYTGRPQCALALRRVKNGAYYEGATILSLDMAYSNARLIARPDITWLNRENRMETPSVQACEIVLSDRLMKLSPPQAAAEAVGAGVSEAAQVEDSSSDDDDDQFSGETPPDPQKVGQIATLTNIVSRPSGKGLRGDIYGSIGTIARNLLKAPVPTYTGGSLKVRIVDVNPQGSQYLLEPVE